MEQFCFSTLFKTITSKLCSFYTYRVNSVALTTLNGSKKGGIQTFIKVTTRSHYEKKFTPNFFFK